MKGVMYIAGSFHTVRRVVCGGGRGWIDNDPHFWTSPATWGICRNDLRHRVELGDYVFYVLPKNAKHPQCLFAYLQVGEKISHVKAFARHELRSKRMGNKNPNGNIIVDATGAYNRFDNNVHRHKFENIREEYVIGRAESSRLLTASEIDRLAPKFIDLLKRLFCGAGSRPIDFISRYGKTLSAAPVDTILRWIHA